ncbi:hypothetical protein NIES4103_16640 [Nostoc sp. NIES-4103]|nr:hypothetical protein NIES4103_16640 [Nostoc sp. NIES-4103]
MKVDPSRVAQLCYPTQVLGVLVYAVVFLYPGLLDFTVVTFEYWVRK